MSPRHVQGATSRNGRRHPARRPARRRTRWLRQTRRRLRRALRAVRQAGRLLRAAPPAIRLMVAAMVVMAVWSTVNAVYQVTRKPSELFFPVSGALDKTPAQTWHRYARLFRKHSTAVVSPEFLAALAQVEGAGNPVARTYWRWRAAWNPFEIYRPASSAVGMFQITDATFREARRYCVHHHVVVEEGPWYDWRSCWFNGLYTRTVPSHAIEMTAAYLDRAVARTLARRAIGSATLEQQQDLAAIVHLCGAGAGDRYARQGFRLAPGQRCGDHDAAAYLARVNALERHFAGLAGHAPGAPAGPRLTPSRGAPTAAAPVTSPR